MERKLSAKAIKMRQRLSFSRSRSARGRSSTLVSPIADSPSPSRPRSASTPESPTHDGPTWDNAESGRGYTFTDELGYFRPESPIIDRRLIGEDLEADIKHACALLSHSIDRGIPAGLSYQSAVPDWTEAQKHESNAEAPVDQHILLVPAIKADPETETSKKHDSGVGMSFSSPDQPARPHGNSLSGADTSRFYNRPPTSPPQSPSLSPTSRQSIVSLEDQPWERSYSPSPAPIPRSHSPNPPDWPNTPESPVSPFHETEKPTPNPLNCEPSQSETSTPISPPTLGEAGMTWLRASKEIQRLEEKAKTKARPKATRFYSSCNRSVAASDSREWLSRNFWERDPSVEEASLVSGTGSARAGSGSVNEFPAYPYQAWTGRGMSYSSSCLGDEFKHQENVYSVVVPSEPMNKRKKASLLLKKLAGIGMRLKDGAALR